MSETPPSSFAVIGDTNLARHVCASLQDRANEVNHLIAPGDDQLRKALFASGDDGLPRALPVDGVAVLLHDDVAALRYALAIAHLAPEVPIIVTIFDRTVARELRRVLPQCHVTSPADIAAPALAGPCVESFISAIHPRPEGARAIGMVSGELRIRQWAPRRRLGHGLRNWMGGQLRPHDGGTKLMLAGLLGMFIALATDWIWLLGIGLGPAESFFEAARVVATVGPAAPHDDSAAYQVVTGAAMLGTIVFTGMFVAGLIDRLLGPKLVGLIGPRSLPRVGHVIVVGMGQIGLRLCEDLRGLAIPVVGVERDRHAPNVRLARSLGIPVLAGHGGDRDVLEHLHLRDAKAIAAVGSDDLDNIAVALAAHAVAPETRIVLRAGEHEAIAETRSLLPLGTIRDVNRLAAAYVLAHLRQREIAGVVAYRGQVFVETGEDGFESWPLTDREACGHLTAAARL